jgi:tetratricopeptide (TPR) repeat protein
MTGNQNIFQEAINQGHSAAWDQDWEQAANFYRQAMEEFPDNSKALTSLALALFELQKFEEAREYYQRAAELSPNDPIPLQKIAEIQERVGNLSIATKIYMDVAELFARSKDVEKAIENWSRVVSLDPEHLPAHSRLALIYERLGRSTQALVEYLSIASLLQHNGEIQKATQTVNHALQVIPDSKEAKQALSMLQTGKILPKPRRSRGVTGPLMMAQVRQLELPKSIGDERPKLDPIQDAKQKALTMLADLLFEQGDTQSIQARQGLQSIIKGTGALGHAQIDQTKIILHLSQVIDMQSHGQDDQAIPELERAIEAGLDNSAAYYDLGLLLSKSERLESAVRNLQRAVKHELFGLGARLLLGLTLYKMERTKEASIEYLEALRIADAESVPADQAEELSQLYEPLIEAFIQQADTKLQKRICENISKLLIRPDWRDQTRRARQQLPAQPAGSPPVPLAEILTEATSSQVVESLAKVNQLARAHKIRAAMEEAFYALKFAPTYLPLHICIGDLLFQEDRMPEAIKKYSVVAESYSIRGEANRAINLLKKVVELAPMDMEARNHLIDLMMARGNNQETVREFLKLAETYYSLADLAMARKTFTRALRFAQQANVDRDTKVKLLHRMADIDMQSLDWRSALRIFEQVRTLEPDDEASRDMLIDLNIRLGQSSQALAELDNYLNHLISTNHQTKAVEYINSKIQENPTQPALHRRLAEIYRQMERKEDAIEQLDIAGEMFIQAGNRSAAIEAIMAILALNPINTNDYQKLLAELQAES